MQDYEQEKQQTASPPAWRSSQGRMWETSAAPQKDGRDQLTGYRPGEKEDRPRETGRLSGSYGDVAVGSNRKKELTLVASKRRSHAGPAATEDEKALRSDGSKKATPPAGNVRVNPHDETKSAVSTRISHQKQPTQLLAGFRRQQRKNEDGLLDEQLPFLNPEPEREALRQLTGQTQALRAQDGASPALDAMERSKQRLRQELTEKAAQEHRLLLILQKAQEASRRRAGETAQVIPLLTPVSEEPPPEDGDGGGDGNPPEDDALAEEARRLFREALGEQSDRSDGDLPDTSQ
ncbi:MAG: hypothetical protein RR295_02720 [Oscillospiraceae bacterium]